MACSRFFGLIGGLQLKKKEQMSKQGNVAFFNENIV